MQMWSVVFSSSIEGISLKDPDQIKCDKNDIDVPLPPEINEITWFCSLHRKVIRLPEGHHWCLCHLKVVGDIIMLSRNISGLVPLPPESHG